MDFDDLTPEMKAKAMACKSMEELAELAKAVGDKLSDEQLEAVAGGAQSDICRKDYGCLSKSLRPPCTSKDSCPTFFEDLIKNCTELAPVECTTMLDGAEVFPCGILKAQ